MSYQKYNVTHTPYGGGSTTNITTAVDIRSDEGVEAKTDTWKLRVLKKSLGSLDIQLEDNIKIYMGGSTAGDIVMDGLVKETDYVIAIEGRYLMLKGVNKLESLLTNPMPCAFSKADVKAPGGVGWVASEAIKYLIDHVNSFNTMSDNWVNMGTGEVVATTKHIDYYSEYKPVFQHIEELSNDDYTDNGQYVMYLDTSNNLVWKPRPTVTSGTLTEGANDILGMTIQRGTWDTINYIIVNCGNDLLGHKITNYSTNLQSIGKIGFKGKYVAKPEIAKNYIATHISADNDGVRTGTRAWGKVWGDMIVKLLGGARHKAKIEVRGNKSYGKGDLWTIAPNDYTFSNGASTYNMRLVQVTHNFSIGGWTTTLNFEEDEDTALANL